MELVEKSCVGSDDLIYRTVSYISGNFRRQFSLEDMARDLGAVSYTHLTDQCLTASSQYWSVDKTAFTLVYHFVHILSIFVYRHFLCKNV